MSKVLKFICSSNTSTVKRPTKFSNGRNRKTNRKKSNRIGKVRGWWRPYLDISRRNIRSKPETFAGLIVDCEKEDTRNQSKPTKKKENNGYHLGTLETQTKRSGYIESLFRFRRPMHAWHNLRKCYWHDGCSKIWWLQCISMRWYCEGRCWGWRQGRFGTTVVVWIPLYTHALWCIARNSLVVAPKRFPFKTDEARNMRFLYVMHALGIDAK